MYAITGNKNVIRQECNGRLMSLHTDILVLFFISIRGSKLESESCQNERLRIGRTCFHDLTEYNEIIDSA